jgi:hypothetical protein
LTAGELAIWGCLFGHTQMVPQVVEKIKHMFEFSLHLSVVGGIFLLSNRCSKTFPKVVR